MVIEQLIIYLTPPTLTPQWMIVCADRQMQVHHGNHELLVSAAEGKEVIIVVPAEDVLLTSVKLPKMNRSRQLQVLPYALEEKLIADVETLHFALLANLPDEQAAVAVVAKDKMQKWLSLCAEWKIQPDYLLPVSLALPFSENHWTILIDQMVVVRTHVYTGFACDHANAQTMLTAALAASSSVPIEIDIYQTNEEEKLMSDLVSVKKNVMKSEQIARWLFLSAANNTSTNLLQGMYAVKKSRLPHMQKLWKLISYVGMGWLVLLVLYPMISYFILSDRLNGIEDQIKKIYQRHFPQATQVVSPKVRMEEELRKYAIDAGENHVLELINDVGNALSEASGIQLKQFHYQENQLTLELTANSSEELSTFINKLSQQNVKVKQQNANLSDSRIEATLMIE